MQEETTNRTINLYIKGGKISADILRVAMRKYLGYLGAQLKKEENLRQIKKNEEIRVKARDKAEKKLEKKKPHGKQTMKNLMSYGDQLTNIRITDNNIKSFDRVARKYSIDYSLKKDNSVDPPNYMVFFKAKDVDVMTAAFKEYAGASLKKSKKPSLRQKLVKTMQKAKGQHRQRQRVSQKDRGQVR